MQLRLKNAWLDLSSPVVMGVLNVTPDSFSDAGRFVQLDAAIRHAERMIADGAGIVDVGGESTRPGAAAVTTQQEVDRVVPVVEALSRRFEIVVSVDTSKAAVMREAAHAGADMINDVYALRREGALAEAAGLGVAVCLMHMQGDPATMQINPQYGNVTAEIAAFLEERVATCEAAGVVRERIAVDPGFGFGKTRTHNARLMAELSTLASLGLPLLVGLSRKKTLGEITGRPVEQRVAAGLAAAVLAVVRGAHIVRTHDVAPTVDALRVVTEMSGEM